MSLRIRPLLPFLLVLLAIGYLLLGPDAALAAGGGSAGNFSCTNGHATGDLYSSTTDCPTALGFDNIFSFLVCNMEELSSNLMGNMFCGMITNMAPAVSAVLVLATVIFGIAFTIGVIPATAREFQMFLLKVSFVWVFATQSDYLIDYGYAFFINGIRDGVAIALTGYQPGTSTSTVYTQLDGFLAAMIRFATDYIGVSKTAANGDTCKNALFAVMAIMAIAFPPIFFLALALIMKLAVTFVRAVFGYIYALVGIAFLMTLAPFFLSFFLFRQTRPFFDKWIGYMASFALQIIILFAFLAFILSLNQPNADGSPSAITNITGSIPALIMARSETKEGGSFRAPWDYCTICDFVVVDSKHPDKVLQPNQYKNVLGTGTLQCKDNPPKAIGIDTNFTPNKSQQGALLKFAGAGFMSLLLLAYVIEALLGYVASLAQILASGIGGATFAPQLGGGASISGRPTVQMPFENNYQDFETGMDRGYSMNRVNASGQPTGRDTISRTAQGMKEAFRGMIGGQRTIQRKDKDGKIFDDYETMTDRQGNTTSGFNSRFLDWLVDPNRIDQ